MTAFTWTPQTAEKTTAPRVRTASFGDGYEQRVGDGINTQPAKWTLSFSRETAIIDSIEAYLVAAGGVSAFAWTPPGETTQIKVVCREWRRAPYAGLKAASMSATFDQVFGA